MIKNIFPIIFFFLVNASYAQDVATLVKLNELCGKLGINSSISIDTMLINTKNEKITRRVTEHQLLLLKASEYYINNDYENSLYFIKQVELKFRNNGLNGLKYLVHIGSYAHLNMPIEAAKFYYVANRINCIDPANMQRINNEIKNTLSKELFEKGLSRYYYYHQRIKILVEIYD